MEGKKRGDEVGGQEDEINEMSVKRNVSTSNIFHRLKSFMY